MIKKYYKNPIETSIAKEALSYNINNVLVALSGGADSIATAFALNKIGVNILALHCNFHLRGEESNRDAEFVHNFCETYNIPLEVKNFDVTDYMNSYKGVSLEMACRNLRYEWFESQLKKLSFDRIVTGHNADDNIETFFLNMMRGSGSRGLKGMMQDTGQIWRPLLSFHRPEIINYLEKNMLSFVVDSTNLKSDYRRNYIRNEIIPLLKKEWKGFDKAMDKTIAHLREENKIIEVSLSQILKGNSKRLKVMDILEFPAPSLLVKRFIDPLEPFSTTQEEVLSAISANKPHIRKWHLKKGDLILRNGVLSIEMCHSECSS